MSKHILKFSSDGLTLKLTIGFDKLKYFYMTIENEDDLVVYSNLDDNEIPSSAMGASLEYYRKKALSFGITIPHEMIAEVYNDGQLGILSKEVQHFTNPYRREPRGKKATS